MKLKVREECYLYIWNDPPVVKMAELPLGNSTKLHIQHKRETYTLDTPTTTYYESEQNIQVSIELKQH